MATLVLRPNSYIGQYTNGNGQWYGSDWTGNPVYTAVDEVTLDTNDYNAFFSDIKYAVSTGNHYYGFPNHSTETGVISSVAVYGYIDIAGSAQGNETGGCVLVGGGQYLLHHYPVPGTYAYNDVWYANPYTGVAWTWTDIDNLSAGWYYAGTATLDGKWVFCNLYQLYVTVTYTQPPAAPTNVAASENNSSQVTVTWTKSSGATNYRIYRNGGNISGTLGNVATYSDTSAAAPTITPGSSVASDGTSTAHVALSLSGTSIAKGTTYTYTVYAYNAGGWSVVSSGDTGYRPASALYYQWQRYDTSAYVNIGSNTTTSTYNDTGAPAPTITGGTAAASDGTSTAHVALSISGQSANVGATKTYRCYLTATGSSAVYSGTNTGYRGVGALVYQWYRSDGDSAGSYNTPVGGNVSSYNDTGAPAPTITGGSTVASDGTSTAHVALSLSGTSNNIGAGRYYYCSLSATGASAVGSSADRGYRAAGTLTYQWERSAADSDADYSSLSGATASTYNDTGAPEDGSGRYYKCYLTASPATAVYSAVDRGYRIVGFIPKIMFL